MGGDCEGTGDESVTERLCGYILYRVSRNIQSLTGDIEFQVHIRKSHRPINSTSKGEITTPDLEDQRSDRLNPKQIECSFTFMIQTTESYSWLDVCVGESEALQLAEQWG